MRTAITRIYLLTLIAFFVLQTSCTKTDYVIEKPEKPESNSAPGTFSVSAEKVTDTEIQLNWISPVDEQSDLKSFEIGLNDSIIAYGLSEETNTYQLENLQPDTEYKLSVVAVDEANNTSTVTTTAKTLKSFIKEVFQLNLGYEFYDFSKVIETADGGFLIVGRGTINTYLSPLNVFIMKVKSDYSIEWKKEYGEFNSSYSTDFPRSLLKYIDGGYLITRDHALTKLDASGNIQWTYLLPDEYESSLVSSAFDSSGDFFSTGYSKRKQPDGSSVLEYFLIKISANGIEQWHQYGNHPKTNSPHSIYILNDNSILLAGIAESTDSTNNAGVSCFWTLRMNENGEELNENFYPNDSQDEDILFATHLAPEGTITFLGAIAGYFPPNGYYNTYTRALMVDLDGNIIWDIYPNLSDSHTFSYFTTYNTAQNGDLFVLSIDDQGIILNTLSSDGNISEIKNLRNYPNMLFIRDNPKGLYELISADGYWFICNKDGYWPENQ